MLFVKITYVSFYLITPFYVLALEFLYFYSIINKKHFVSWSFSLQHANIKSTPLCSKKQVAALCTLNPFYLFYLSSVTSNGYSLLMSQEIFMRGQYFIFHNHWQKKKKKKVNSHLSRTLPKVMLHIKRNCKNNVNKAK